MTDEHFNERDDEDEIICGDCGRTFLQISCYQIHKSRKLNGVYETYCVFLRTLRNCDDCRTDFSLSLKCSHFGKKRKKLKGGNRVFFSNTSNSYCGPSKFVKCGCCSEFYVRKVSNNQNCFLRKTDSILGDEKKRSVLYTLKMFSIMI